MLFEQKDETKAEMLQYEEIGLFKQLCVAIAEKDLDITADDMTKYASSVCDAFRKRFN